MKKKGQKKKLKASAKVLLRLLLVVLVFIIALFYLLNIDTKNIVIEGNENIRDVEIIRTAGLKDYPKIYRLRPKKMKKELMNIPLIEDVKIKRNIFGKITIKVKETKILLFYKYDNKFISESGKRIDNSDEFFGYPTLINFTPDTIFEGLITGLNKVDYKIIKMINEIEYSPYKGQNGTTIDNNRFILKMNDGNTVYIDIPNIKNLNKYTTIIATPDMEKTKGVVYLDTMNKQIVFRSYDAIKKEEENKASKTEEGKEEKKEEAGE